LTETRELDERGRPILCGGKLYLGDINVRRDFGFAGDFVDAMLLIVQNETASDFVIGTGQSHSIAEFCEAAFGVVGLDWTKYVAIDQSLVRKVENRYTRADATKLRSELGWHPEVTFSGLVTMMVQKRTRILEMALQPHQLAQRDRFS
jgi:GDPmannose 4,6-dehydratase